MQNRAASPFDRTSETVPQVNQPPQPKEIEERKQRPKAKGGFFAK
jgi:hypothetical protein